MEERVVTHRYRDPLSELWLSCAAKIGLRVERCVDAFAHYDGKGLLQLAEDSYLDADDCLAQMIFHELCHSLVAGPEAFDKEDWALDNTCDDDHWQEHATLQCQAVLAGRYGLRRVLGPTTVFRAYYDALPEAPLEAGRHPVSARARQAIRLAATNPYWPHLQRALEDTAAMLAIAKRWPAPGSAPSLFLELQEPLPAHPTGLPGRAGAAQCGACAWRTPKGLCRQASTDVDDALPACERFELPFDCLDCGACCGAAYHSVTIAPGDAIEHKHPELLVIREDYIELRREDDHCAALYEKEERVYCKVYDDRPTCCREFENAGEHCLTARRRVGYSL